MSGFHERIDARFVQTTFAHKLTGSLESAPSKPAGSAATSFMNRKMPPPPSSPHHAPSLSSDSHLSRNYPPNPSINPSSRDTAPSTPAHRPNDMSISSIMGIDSPSGPNRPSSSVFGAEKSTTSMTYGPPGIGQAAFRPPRDGAQTRPRTPDDPKAHTSRPLKSPMDLPRPSLEQRSEPQGYHDPTQSGGRSLLQPFHPTPQSSGHNVPPRPYSQPAGIDSPRNGNHSSAPRDPYQAQISFDQDTHLGRRTVSDEQRPALPLDNRAPREQHMTDIHGARRSPYGMSEPWSLPEQPYRPPYDAGPVKGPAVRHYERPSSPLMRIDYQNIHADRPIASREGADPPESRNFPSELVGPQYGPFLPNEDARMNTQPTPHDRNAVPASTISGDPRNGDQGNDIYQPAGGSVNGKSRRPLLDPGLQRSLEESQMSHRSLLGASQETHRRIDRASPLPQAVQGASAQPAGSGRDPSIKSEFGRMFSGIGSGVGSTPQPMPPSHGNGSPTPARRTSRFDEGDVEMIDRPGSFDSNGLDRVSAARRGKRLLDRDGRATSQNGDGTLSPMQALSGRGGKRSRQANASHHHHHAHGHQ